MVGAMVLVSDMLCTASALVTIGLGAVADR
jgi:hypothetical protein